MPEKCCPMCRTACLERSKECRGCGYAFGQPVETTRALLREQMRGAKAGLIGVLLLDLIVAGVVAAMVISTVFFGPVLVWLGGFVFLIVAHIRVVQKLLMTRSSLRSLDRQFPELPAARVVSAAAQDQDREAERQ